MVSLIVSEGKVGGVPTHISLEIHCKEEAYEFATMLRELAKESVNGDFYADTLCELTAAEKIREIADKIPKWNKEN